MSDPAPKKRDPRRIVLALQFWEGDRDRAMRLAQLIADIEPTKNEHVDFAFVARFDAVPDLDVVQKVSRKFNVWNLRGTRRGTGWPHGCNELALDLLQQSAARSRPGREWSAVTHKAVYLLESDNMPMCKNWLSRISDEWDVAQEAGAMVMGAWSPFHSPVGHINGNMLVRPDLTLKLQGVIGCGAQYGWDCYFADKFYPVWYKSVLMANHYDFKTNIPPEILFSCVDGITPPAVVHGVKDHTAELQVRKILFAP